MYIQEANMNIMTPQARAVSLNDTEKELKYYDQLHQEKCRDKNQTFKEHAARISINLGSTELHQLEIYNALIRRRFLPAGRIQAALGATEREVSPFNCSVSQRIEDDMPSIMAALSNAALILRLGTGIGYNFSHIRPKGALIKKLQTEASGPLSFMKMYDVMASTIASSGHRRGAQMGILNVSHPDIFDFVNAKMEKGAYRQFNLSVGITDSFMLAVKNGSKFPLTFAGEIYSEISAIDLWNKILTNAYNSSEPGIIFIDRLNQNNNLYYCEQIEATNPCAEQPLPPYGLCTLGSFNLPAYLHEVDSVLEFDLEQFKEDIHVFVEAYDNIFDSSIYAIPEHKQEALNKRRIGLGFTGISTCLELMSGIPCYGSNDFCGGLEVLLQTLRDETYRASINLAKLRGPFTLFDERYLDGEYIKTLPPDIYADISKYGIRNSHLISFAPCGTISQYAGNVSSGVEPIFYHTMQRDVYMQSGLESVTINDYAYRNYGFKGKTLEECTIQEHLAVASTIQKYTDSAISKTVNVPSSCSFEEYKSIYNDAYDLGLKGITVYRPTELRGAVITKAQPKESCANGACSL